ncbi:MAG: hypothetical protein BGO09_04405 [Bacteroidetes bacterium 47-18]|nr:MAG: hypothetical protein BGO09_04405 [Bacteroidetes bacterium 47-18]
MNTFIAFFDVMRFKEFIYNNDPQETKRLFDHLLRDSQIALAKENYVNGKSGGVYPDLSYQTVNCLHVSDSIVFWTDTDGENDFNELVDVCYRFYWLSLQATFPLRGCLTYGEVNFTPTSIKNNNNRTFFNYSLFGKGRVEAYTKADSIEYAGCLLDQQAIAKISDALINKLIGDQKICLYKVPFKKGNSYEHVFRPIKGFHNDVSFRNSDLGIKRLFTFHTKQDIEKLPESVNQKLNNTIDFLNYFRMANSNEKTS